MSRWSQLSPNVGNLRNKRIMLFTLILSQLRTEIIINKMMHTFVWVLYTHFAIDVSFNSGIISCLDTTSSRASLHQATFTWLLKKATLNWEVYSGWRETLDSNNHGNNLVIIFIVYKWFIWFWLVILKIQYCDRN